MVFVEDFKKFVMRGNVIDLSVAVVMGTAFGKIVNAIVEQLFMPVVGAVVPGGEWRTWTVTPLNIKIGALLGSIVDFLIVALVLFLVVRVVTRVYSGRVETKECPLCLEKVPLAAKRCRACTSELIPT